VEERPKEFYPDYLSEIVSAIFLTLGLVFVLAMLFPPSIGREINFTTAYQPKPEWYFLWLYQMVRYFPGKYAFLGAVLIPLLFIALLIYTPFIDRGTPSRKITIRCSVFLFIGLLVLTLIPLLMP
jgi:quinol-cytochrome oxidoreductase complex cytochrome b subunit